MIKYLLSVLGSLLLSCAVYASSHESMGGEIKDEPEVRERAEQEAEEKQQAMQKEVDAEVDRRMEQKEAAEGEALQLQHKADF